MLWLTWSSVRKGIWVDLDVYRAGGAAVLDQAPLYDIRVEDLPFTYPPFAAILFVPAALAPEVLARLGMTALTVLSLVVVLEVVRRRLGLGVGAAAPVLLVILALEPVFRTVLLGQVNVVLLALVVLDCLVVPRRWRGVLIGIAIGIKLTPAVFVLWLLLRREWGGVLRVGLGFLATVAVGFVALPGPSGFFWGGGFADLGRFGSAAVLGVDNQSASAAIARAAGLGAPSTVLVLVTGLVSVAAAAVVAHRRLAAGDDVGALLAVALGGLLASPISWSHHWVWVVVALLWLRAHGRTVWVALLAPIFWLGPFWAFHRWPPTDAPYGIPARIVATAYVVLGVVLLALLAHGDRPTPADRAPQCGEAPDG
jgi:alpha-1,2-mannosyltransferase